MIKNFIVVVILAGGIVAVAVVVVLQRQFSNFVGIQVVTVCFFHEKHPQTGISQKYSFGEKDVLFGHFFSKMVSKSKELGHHYLSNDVTVFWG